MSDDLENALKSVLRECVQFHVDQGTQFEDICLEDMIGAFREIGSSPTTESVLEVLQEFYDSDYSWKLCQTVTELLQRVNQERRLRESTLLRTLVDHDKTDELSDILDNTLI